MLVHGVGGHVSEGCVSAELSAAMYMHTEYPAFVHTSKTKNDLHVGNAELHSAQVNNDGLQL